MPTPKQRIHNFYGFDFPNDFFQFREFMAELPRKLLNDVCDLRPTFPFEVAAGRKPKDYPDHPYWQDRYYHDLPEFVTLFWGGSDGRHFGYVFDAPDEHPPIVARYWHSDTFQHTIDGDSLFEATRGVLEKAETDYLNMMESYPDEAALYRKRLKQVEKLRDRLSAHFGADRPETGHKYMDTYYGSAWRKPVAKTWDALGIVVPKGKYRKLKSDPFTGPHEGHRIDPKPTEIKRLVTEATQLLDKGYPGAALKLGRDLWVWAREYPACYELLDAAYAALDREPLRRLMTEARAFRAHCDRERA